MPPLHVLRVFANEDREWGNPLGIFLDGSSIPPEQRQPLAAKLGFSETVFVEDRQAGRIRIHSPTVELPFAGHPTVGSAWLLAHEGTPVQALGTPAGAVDVLVERGMTHVAARPEWAPPFEYLQLDSPTAVREMERPAAANVYAWAWIDEAAGTIRARSFVPLAGIAEDEATGSAVIALCSRLERAVVVHQGHGSVLPARPLPDGRVAVGGNVVLDGIRQVNA